ncbi:uncharacterized protein EAE98_005544 [Botrytis deweyae]|uniref:Metallo-beta-lactamase domain-containing protein n=1 Tax=Botrytis deweyae TaxID=2478750 RepID=A0ABQ7IM40_9HELO|nr:uncharacterized protein EAE98_005544 [Botrytis deweyae]KAF7928488.1 hypothetical protein EAE98_005544 [Botrytis deweyae]
MPRPAPNLNIPPSSTTVSVRIIDTTTHISGIPLSEFVSPAISGHTHLSIPAYSFLIEHPSSRSLLFDLGVRKDWENLAPRITERIKNGGWKITVQKGVREQLEEHEVSAASIEAVIWSHWHWDHIGDPSTFDKSTALVVGPGFKKSFTPGYPSDNSSPILESDYADRELREIAFNSGLKIGRFEAFDYFGDGSFYLLNSPGHTIGHMCALAKVKTNPNSYVFMGGDACHHGGEFRPSPYHPLPEFLTPARMPSYGITCSAIARRDDGKQVAHDVDEAERTIEKVMEVDASDEVLVVMAHDETLKDVVSFFPRYANGFRENGWAEKGRWLFLRDFVGAVKD